MSDAVKGGPKKSSFGKLPDGREVSLYTLENDNGVQLSITSFGAAVVSIIVPDRYGTFADIALGFDSVEGYCAPDNPFFGATIGRFGNRIARGQFSLGGKTYHLAKNNGVNHLHGGPGGFDKVLWGVPEELDPKKAELSFTYISPDGEEGYPGKLTVTVTYQLTDNNELHLRYKAVSDADTVINLTNHTYFNLKGKGTITDHLLKLNSEYFTPVDETQIPTGELRSVVGTPFDFRKFVIIGDRIDQPDDDQISYGAGYDHNFIVSSFDGKMKKAVATVYCEETGRLLEVESTEPGVQFYSGNFIQNTLKGKNGVNYTKRSGFCLETQHYPDSPNKPSFPSTVLKAHEIFNSFTVYRFRVAENFI